MRSGKLLLIGDYPPPQGGIAVHVRQLFQAFSAAGMDVRVLDIGKGGASERGVVSARTGPAFLKSLARFALSGHQMHLHTSGNNRKAWAVAATVALASRAGGSAPVITLHSGLLPRFLRQSVANRLMVKTVLGGFERVVAVSDAIRFALEKAGVEGGKIGVHPAFLASQVRPGSLPNGFEQVRAAHHPLLAMAHHPSPVYGLQVVLPALARLRNTFPKAGLALFGPGLDQPEFVDAVSSADLAEAVHGFGELEHERALALISGCDVFVRPTTADGDSISVREALTLGVRCIASDVCSRPEGTQLFQSEDPAGLTEAIARALAAEPRRVSSPDAAPFLRALYADLTFSTGVHPVASLEN